LARALQGGDPFLAFSSMRNPHHHHYRAPYPYARFSQHPLPQPRNKANAGDRAPLRREPLDLDEVLAHQLQMQMQNDSDNDSNEYEEAIPHPLVMPPRYNHGISRREFFPLSNNNNDLSSRERERQEELDRNLAFQLHAQDGPLARRTQWRLSRGRMPNRLMLSLGMIDRDFNADDYEMLCRLDEGNKSKGAKKSQIKTLPAHTVQEGDTVENCCICLSDMEPGNKVRTLPCSHFFHTECIDNWLKLNKVCPIDKTTIGK